MTPTRWHPVCNRAAGFTIVELVISLAIMAVLLFLAIPSLQLADQRKKEQDLRFALIEIRQALDSYRVASREGRIVREPNREGFPERLEELVEGVEDQWDPKKRKLYFLRRLPPDPMNTELGITPAETWGLRSYQSPPEDPREGAEIFDVYSRSGQVGLNGVPYRDW